MKTRRFESAPCGEEVNAALASTAYTLSRVSNSGSQLRCTSVANGLDMTWGVIDVRECGAAGDGHADDTEPVLKAVDKLPESGGFLYFPPGVDRFVA